MLTASNKERVCDPDDIRFLGDVQRLELFPGDWIVLSVDQVLSMDMAERVKKQMEERFPDHRIVVLSRGMKLGVVGAPIIEVN